MPNSEIRVGRISSIDYKAGMARVTYRDKDESVSSVFPIVTNNDEYRMPEIGQDVLVAHLSNGSSRGAIIGTIWNKKYAPVETGEKLYRKDLSRKKDAAYIRYSDEEGEYLLKVANLHLNGVNKVLLDGPKVEIAANISINLESELMEMDISEIQVSGGEAGKLDARIETEVSICQEENQLQAKILHALLEFLEGLEIKSGMDIRVEAKGKADAAAEEINLKGNSTVKISSGGELQLSDSENSITLKELIKRLEALEGR